ncbi:MAG TPA: hypothetical protein VIV60_31875 [Polyangiaceae bacterium]
MTPTNLPTSMRVGPYEPSVLVRFRPAWAYIEGIREFGRFFCQTTFNEPRLAERAQVMIQETLENAVKYSERDALSDLELVMSLDSGQLEISVCSSPSPEHLGTLRHELGMLNSQDPEQAYLAAFERASRDPEASARLGLARLRYECGAELSVSEEEHGRIRVTARATL